MPSLDMPITRCIEVRNLFLSVFDDAVLSDIRGKVDFSHTIIIMTSNVGANEIIKQYKNNPNTSDADYQNLAKKALGENGFTPEFVNRINQICVFKPFDFFGLKNIALRWVREQTQKF